MSRLALLLCLPVALGAAFAQTLSQYEVGTNVPGAEFFVDGQRYTTTAAFFWATGSKHVLRVDHTKQFGGPQSQYVFTGWSSASGTTTESTRLLDITATPEAPVYTATFSIQYLVTYKLNAPPGAATGTCTGIDTTSSGTICPAADGSQWVDAGQTITLLSPVAAPGWVFHGWTLSGGTPMATMTAVVNSPLYYSGHWEAGRRIIVQSNPPGMMLIINRSPTPAADPSNTCSDPTRLCPGQFDVPAGSSLLLAAPDVQQDLSGAKWTLDSFTVGPTVLGGVNTVYPVDSLGSAVVIVANFVRAMQVSFYTQPSGLKLTVNGRDNWPSYNFWWGVGSKNTVSAAAQQTDAKGRRYTFHGWSNGGDATQTVTPAQDDLTRGGIQMVATYDVLGRLTVNGSVPGVVLLVDGAPCAAPCQVDRPAGTDVHLVAPASVPLGAGTRADFSGWSDGGSADRVVKMTSDAVALSANYSTLYRLDAASDPSNGVTFRSEPGSADGYYAAGTSVVLSAETKPGFRFRRWDGDLSGTYPSGTVNLSRPISVLALLDRVPYVAPAGVQNAAGDTPDHLVAPGSIVSIYGESLGADVSVGPNSPLAQTLGGLAVTLQDRIIPLYFASPQQINAQLPSDLAEGTYTLTVTTAASQTVTAEFTVARDAPGVFTRPVDGKPVVMATREDGQAVTPDTRVHSGEIITFYGTGFGPYDRPAVDGFAFPDFPEYKVADTVEILTADQQVYAPEWAGGAAGFTGMVAVRFRVPDALPPGANWEFAVRVGGRVSNSVLLPID